jgi:hypothetical protein
LRFSARPRPAVFFETLKEKAFTGADKIPEEIFPNL